MENDILQLFLDYGVGVVALLLLYVTTQRLTKLLETSLSMFASLKTQQDETEDAVENLEHALVNSRTAMTTAVSELLDFMRGVTSAQSNLEKHIDEELVEQRSQHAAILESIVNVETTVNGVAKDVEHVRLLAEKCAENDAQ